MSILKHFWETKNNREIRYRKIIVLCWKGYLSGCTCLIAMQRQYHSATRARQHRRHHTSAVRSLGLRSRVIIQTNCDRYLKILMVQFWNDDRSFSHWLLAPEYLQNFEPPTTPTNSKTTTRPPLCNTARQDESRTHLSLRGTKCSFGS